MTMDTDDLLTPEQAVAWLNLRNPKPISVVTLRYWQRVGFKNLNSPSIPVIRLRSATTFPARTLFRRDVIIDFLRVSISILRSQGWTDRQIQLLGLNPRIWGQELAP